jgi:NitT/TauT family transport system ATP-binding protein
MSGAQGLRLEAVGKAFSGIGTAVQALSSVSLDVSAGEFVAIVGPSGCGKSTLLQIAAGLLPSSSGRVLFDGVPVSAPPPQLVYLFQQYSKSLFPWRTAEQNVMFAFRHRMPMSDREAHERCLKYLAMVGLADFAGHYPWQLSGGMQQRIAIARALAAEPAALLMDEPFSSVDALTRIDLQTLILDLWTQNRFTAVLVTHDVDEAVFLADRVAVMSHRPATIAEVLETGLPRPRRAVETREDPRFVALRAHLLKTLLTRPSDAAQSA